MKPLRLLDAYRLLASVVKKEFKLTHKREQARLIRLVETVAKDSQA